MKIHFLLLRLISIFVIFAPFTSCNLLSLKPDGKVVFWINNPDQELITLAGKTTGLNLIEATKEETWSVQLAKEPASIDLIYVEWGRDLDNAVQEGLLSPIDPYLNRMPRLKQMWPGLRRETDTVKMQFLPTTVYTWGLFYNKKVLADLGIETPTNWKEFIDSLTAIKAKGIQPISLGSSFGWPATAWFSYLDLRINGVKKHKDLQEGRRQFDDPSLIPIYEVLQSWRDLGLLDPLSSTKNWPEAIMDLTNGKSAFLLLSSSAWLRISNTSDIGFRAVPVNLDKNVPRGEIVVVQGFALSAKAQAPEAAMNLAYTYLVDGALGQTNDIFRLPSLRRHNDKRSANPSSIKEDQEKILLQAELLVPQIDRFLPTQAGYDVNQAMISFFALNSKMTASDLALVLTQATKVIK